MQFTWDFALRNFFGGTRYQKKSPCISLNLEKGSILLIFVRKAVQEETSRNVEESARWLSSAPGRLQPVQEEAGGLPHLTHNKGEVSPQASQLVRSQSMVAKKLKD